ncbi:hypothetical protein E4U55_001795 [Claviceps digitariae]|nr:hypothetical protein E4U55_001795 [Claviceps digitariae]
MASIKWPKVRRFSSGAAAPRCSSAVRAAAKKIALLGQLLGQPSDCLAAVLTGTAMTRKNQRETSRYLLACLAAAHAELFNDGFNHTTRTITATIKAIINAAITITTTTTTISPSAAKGAVASALLEAAEGHKRNLEKEKQQNKNEKHEWEKAAAKLAAAVSALRRQTGAATARAAASQVAAAVTLKRAVDKNAAATTSPPLQRPELDMKNREQQIKKQDQENRSREIGLWYGLMVFACGFRRVMYAICMLESYVLLSFVMFCGW